MSDLSGLREQDAWGLSRSFGSVERTSAQKDKILGPERRSGGAGPLAERFCARGPEAQGPVLTPGSGRAAGGTEKGERTGAYD